MKSKETRLRDWNRGYCRMSKLSDALEIKRNSITRLKHNPKRPAYLVRQLSWNQKKLDYEIETIELSAVFDNVVVFLKSKETRLRDWNADDIAAMDDNALELEIKRNSITRLKLTKDIHIRHRHQFSWNQKKLDYEIETFMPSSCICFRNSLEIKRNSITRLKLSNFTESNFKFFPWNQKKLDYEIETQRVRELGRVPNGPWNQKKLDYEIETIEVFPVRCALSILEIKRNSITRLKRVICIGIGWRNGYLKSKETRLRDWNMKITLETFESTGWLEIKRNSITRLKLLDAQTRVVRRAFAWNQKKLDYEIETVVSPAGSVNCTLHLKSKETRLRDWN